jgi:hypothetical protein
MPNELSYEAQTNKLRRMCVGMPEYHCRIFDQAIAAAALIARSADAALAEKDARHQREMNLVVGIATNLMTLAGLSWANEVAPLCNFAGDIDWAERSWRAASSKAHKAIAEKDAEIERLRNENEKLKGFAATLSGKGLRMLADAFDAAFPNDEHPEIQTDLREAADAIDGIHTLIGAAPSPEAKK